MLVVIIVVLAAAAVIKLVAALCGHTITWRLAIVLTTVLAIVLAVTIVHLLW